jgi:hypothetical protein
MLDAVLLSLMLVKIHNISTKDFLSDFFKIWNQKPHAKMVDFLIWKTAVNRRNLLINGETYTILTNKEAKEKRTIVAIIAETKGDVVIY